MTYIDEVKLINNKKFLRTFSDFLLNFKKVKSNYDLTSMSLPFAVIILNFTYGFNTLMEYYLKNPDKQNLIDSDFNNFFSNHKGEFFKVDFDFNVSISSPIINLALNAENNNKDGVSFSYPATQDFFSKFSKYLRNKNIPSLEVHVNKKHFSLAFKTIQYYDTDSFYHEADMFFDQIYKTEFALNKTHINKLCTISFFNHTNKLKEASLGALEGDFYLNFFRIKERSPYATIYMKDLLRQLSFYKNKGEDEFKNATENLQYLDSKQLNQLILYLEQENSSSGLVKDIDEYNLSHLSHLTNFFNSRFDEIEFQNLSKLRILRNLANKKGLVLNYVDERVSLNSLTEKRMLIFGDKLNCEAIIVDLRTLMSRFPSKHDSSDFETFLNTFFKFTRQKKVFDKPVVTKGKRSYSNMFTVFCEKGKNHSEDMLQHLSNCFEDAVNNSASIKNSNKRYITSDEFLIFLEQADRTLSLTNQLGDTSPTSSKKKV